MEVQKKKSFNFSFVKNKTGKGELSGSFVPPADTRITHTSISNLSNLTLKSLLLLDLFSQVEMRC